MLPTSALARGVLLSHTVAIWQQLIAAPCRLRCTWYRVQGLWVTSDSSLQLGLARSWDLTLAESTVCAALIAGASAVDSNGYKCAASGSSLPSGTGGHTILDQAVEASSSYPPVVSPTILLEIEASRARSTSHWESVIPLELLERGKLSMLLIRRIQVSSWN